MTTYLEKASITPERAFAPKFASNTELDNYYTLDFVKINQKGKHAKISVDRDGTGDNYMTVAKVFNVNDLVENDLIISIDNSLI